MSKAFMMCLIRNAYPDAIAFRYWPWSVVSAIHRFPTFKSSGFFWVWKFMRSMRILVHFIGLTSKGRHQFLICVLIFGNTYHLDCKVRTLVTDVMQWLKFTVSITRWEYDTLLLENMSIKIPFVTLLSFSDKSERISNDGSCSCYFLSSGMGIWQISKWSSCSSVWERKSTKTFSEPFINYIAPLNCPMY